MRGLVFDRRSRPARVRSEVGADEAVRGQGGRTAAAERRVWVGGVGVDRKEVVT